MDAFGHVLVVSLHVVELASYMAFGVEMHFAAVAVVAPNYLLASAVASSSPVVQNQNQNVTRHQ